MHLLVEILLFRLLLFSVCLEVCSGQTGTGTVPVTTGPQTNTTNATTNGMTRKQGNMNYTENGTVATTAGGNYYGGGNQSRNSSGAVNSGMTGGTTGGTSGTTAYQTKGSAQKYTGTNRNQGTYGNSTGTTGQFQPTKPGTITGETAQNSAGTSSNRGGNGNSTGKPGMIAGGTTANGGGYGTYTGTSSGAKAGKDWTANTGTGTAASKSPDQTGYGTGYGSQIGTDEWTSVAQNADDSATTITGIPGKVNTGYGTGTGIKYGQTGNDPGATMNPGLTGEANTTSGSNGNGGGGGGGGGVGSGNGTGTGTGNQTSWNPGAAGGNTTGGTGNQPGPGLTNYTSYYPSGNNTENETVVIYNMRRCYECQGQQCNNVTSAQTCQSNTGTCYAQYDVEVTTFSIGCHPLIPMLAKSCDMDLYTFAATYCEYCCKDSDYCNDPRKLKYDLAAVCNGRATCTSGLFGRFSIFLAAMFVYRATRLLI